MLQNIVDFKAQSFLSERNTSTMAYEVKAVRAMWDPSLSIPGTNRRGGWRCPTGTRYGGQITDRFGRSCGWGVARRIANQISDIGSRLENVDDARRGRRIARRERRILARLNPQDARAGRLERGLRGIAERLDGGDAPSPRGAPQRTVVPRIPRLEGPQGSGSMNLPGGGRGIRTPQELNPRPQRRRAPNLRDSEARRMDREIEEPGAPRTGEAPARPRRPTRARRPRGENNLRESEQRRMDREIEEPGAPRTGEAPARRRRAVVEATKKPKAPVRKPEAVVEPKVVKPRRPKPKVDLREPDAGMEEALDREESARRRRAEKPAPVRENVDIGDAPKDFVSAGNGRWTRGAWMVTVDREDERVLGLTASNGRGGLVLARNFDELVERMNVADRRPQPGNSDNAARSEELRQARSQAARQADAVLADADRERAFAMDDPDAFLDAFLPSDLRNLPSDAKIAFKVRWKEEERLNDNALRILEQRIDNEELETEELRWRMNSNNETLKRLNVSLDEQLELLRELQDPANRNSNSRRRIEDRLTRIAITAQDRRYRERDNKIIQAALRIADANRSTPKSKKPKTASRGAGRKVDLNQILDERFFGQYIREDVIPNDRIMIVNDPANFPNGAAERKTKRAEAIQKINRANRGLDKIEKAITRGELSDNDFIERDGEKINVARIKTYLRDYKDAWREVYGGNVFDTSTPEAPAPKAQIARLRAELASVERNLDQMERNGARDAVMRKERARRDDILNQIASLRDKRPRDADGAILTDQTPEPKAPAVPKAPAAPAVDPIDAPFITPDKKDIRNAPEALKHQPPKVEPAKFKAEQEQIIEEAMLEIRDVATLNKFSLLVDQAIFNENEGRQGALRNFQKELTKVAEILKRNPDADINALIAERKREYLANFQMRGGVANARTRLNELETQLRDKFIKLRTPPGNGAEDKERNRVKLMEEIADIKKLIGSYEGHLQLVDALEPEIRKASERIKQGFVFNPDATNIPKPTPADVKKKIKDQISAAIDRRQGKLAKYLEERYPNGGGQFQDMTPEKWRTLSQIQRNEYIKEAYGHPVIKGKNGKLYNAVASVSGGSVEVVFNEINAQGQIIRARIGTSSRSISFNGGEVYQASMFISSKLDRGADIQTIYNQHAFLYLSKIGITKAKVTAADDGQYVWARVGFKRGSGLGRGDLRALESPLKFYEDFGPGGLISNDAEYARIKSILTQAAGGTKFSHQDIIFALDDPTGDKPRMEYVKQWFKPNLGFPGGILKFADQKVGGTPPRRPRRARAPRAPANGGV